MFTAIALVAFATSGMANVEKEKEKLKSKTTEQEQVTVKRNCALIVSSNLNNWEEMYGCIEDSNAYNSLYNLMYAICMTS